MTQTDFKSLVLNTAVALISGDPRPDITEAATTGPARDFVLAYLLRLRRHWPNLYYGLCRHWPNFRSHSKQIAPLMRLSLRTLAHRANAPRDQQPESPQLALFS